MASGNGDPLYGQPYTGTVVPYVDPLTAATPSPVTQTVFNMYSMQPETITRVPGDDHYTTEGNAQRAGDLYHE
jgi:hypothetical protein